MLVGVGDGVSKESLPLAVDERKIVHQFQLAAQVGNLVGFSVQGQIFIALLGEQLEEPRLQRRLALVAFQAVFHRLAGGHDGVFSGGGNDVECVHDSTSINQFFRFPLPMLDKQILKYRRMPIGI